MLLKKLAPWILGCVLFCAACFFSYQQGVAATVEKQLDNEIVSLRESLVDLKNATKDAGEQNIKLNHSINLIKQTQTQSTKVFNDALNATAHMRVNCVFDDDIMRKLNEAASAADKAAASGFSGAMPTGDPPAR